MKEGQELGKQFLSNFCINNMDAWDKRLDLLHWENLEGAGGEGGGRGDRDGEHM